MARAAPPAQCPTTSEQTVYTPPEFLAAVQQTFGPIGLDAASNQPNVCARWFGPGSAEHEDGLLVEWPVGPVVWINPPFRDCAAWASKCVAEAARGVRSLLLTPASLETRWFERVEEQCLALVLRPRLRFVGHTADFPKGLMLSMFGWGVPPGIKPWRWLGKRGER